MTREGNVVQGFISVDPLAEKFPSWSPYSFCFNNPILYVDPTGMAPLTIYENEDTGETVEVKDGVDKTVKVSAEDFQTAKEYASLGELNNRNENWNWEKFSEYENFYTNAQYGNTTSERLSNFGSFAWNGLKEELFGTGLKNPYLEVAVIEDFGLLSGGAGAAKIVKNVKNVKKVVVIGEDMAGRVIPFAKKMGFKYFKPTSKNAANWMRNQKQWIYRQLKDPYTQIIDIGPKGAKAASEYYKAELKAIKRFFSK